MPALNPAADDDADIDKVSCEAGRLISAHHDVCPPLLRVPARPWPCSVFRHFSLPQRCRLALWADLNCSEPSRWPAPQRASSHTRLAQGERLDGHVEEGCTTTPPLDVFHVRPARSIFSSALNFCCSAIAALVRSP